MLKKSLVALAVATLLAVAGAASAKDGGRGKKWAASWMTAPQGTYSGVTTNTPTGPVIASRLVNLALPFTLGTKPQANNQTFRMIVKPDIWGDTMRLKLTNHYGTTAVTFDHVAIGLSSFSGAIVAGTNTQVTFGGSPSVTLAAGQDAWSDAIHVRWAGDDDDGVEVRSLEGRNVAISFYIAGLSGPMTFHSNALVESFLGGPNSGDHAMEESDDAYPYETSSWFFVNELDVMAPSDTRVLVGAGSSSVDGSITTPGNNDRFLNWMSRRLHAAYGQHVSVVNAGIGGDIATIPNQPGDTRPLPEVMPERLARDVLGVSGATDVLFYIATNDFGDHITPDRSIASIANMVKRVHDAGMKAIGSTLISNVGQAGTTSATYAAHDAINQYILAPGSFDSVADFYNATRDPNDANPQTTKIQIRYATHSDPDGTPDWLHLGRYGAEAEADQLDVGFFAPTRRDR